MTTASDAPLREKIMDNIATRFKAVTVGQAVTVWDGSTWTLKRHWNTVARRPLSQTEIKLGNALALFDTKEQKTRETGFDRAHLQLMIEIFVNIAMGEEPSTVLNEAILDVQTVMSLDRTCGGFALDVVEVRNEKDIEGPSDKIVAAMIEVHIVYRHRAGNPRLQH